MCSRRAGRRCPRTCRRCARRSRAPSSSRPSMTLTEPVVQASFSSPRRPVGKHRHRHERLCGAVQRREGVAGERLFQVRRADRRVEHALPVGDDDDLRRGSWKNPPSASSVRRPTSPSNGFGHDPLRSRSARSRSLAGAGLVGHAVDGTALGRHRRRQPRSAGRLRRPVPPAGPGRPRDLICVGAGVDLQHLASRASCSTSNSAM